MTSDLTVPEGTPLPDWMWPPHKCPHCPEHAPSNRLDEHITTAHSDLPPCTARINTQTGGLYSCAFRVGHADGEHGDWHASISGGPMGRFVWTDWAQGAVPHRSEEQPDV